VEVKINYQPVGGKKLSVEEDNGQCHTKSLHFYMKYPASMKNYQE
jgi:hypothetical protein